MGIDSGYGIGSLKTGVCTSTTRPAVPFDGQTISETDTDSLKVYNGSAWAPVSALNFINLTTVTAATTTTISSVFTSTYTNYRLLITLNGSTDSNKLRMTLTASGTPVASGYAAGTFIGDFSSGAPTLLNYGYAGSTRFELGYVPNSATQNASIQLDVFGPQATQKTAINGLTTSVWSGAANAGGMIIGFLDSTTSYDGIQLTNSAGTNMTGTVAIYGYAKA